MLFQKKIPNIVKFKITVLELGPMFIFLKYTKFTAGMIYTSSLNIRLLQLEVQ